MLFLNDVELFDIYFCIAVSHLFYGLTTWSQTSQSAVKAVECLHTGALKKHMSIIVAFKVNTKLY